MEDVAKATRKVGESAKSTHDVFGSLGHHMASQLRRVVLESVGVTAAFGLINGLIDEHKRKLEEASVRLKKLNEGGKYVENYIEKLLRWTGTEFRKPHLVTGLSALQEQVGAQLTWQSFDRAQWVAACSPLEVLGQAVANPEQFRENLQHIIIGASDQVPFWVKTESSKALFAAFETAAVKQEVIRATRKRKLSLGSKGSSLSLEGEDAGAGESMLAEQRAPGEVVVKRPRPDVGGQGQLRKQGDAQFDRFRITYEARQVIQGPPYLLVEFAI
jgi:hypothetical protein